MAGHAQLKFVMTECSKTQIRLTGLTFLRFAHGIVVTAEKEEELGVHVDRLDTITTKYKMGIGPDKTTVMTNNPNGFQREIKIKGQRLEAVGNVKYLGAIISNEGIKIRDSFQDCPDNSSS